MRAWRVYCAMKGRNRETVERHVLLPIFPSPLLQPPTSRSASRCRFRSWLPHACILAKGFLPVSRVEAEIQQCRVGSG